MNGYSNATTVSSNGTAKYKDKNGVEVTLAQGEVLLSKVPPKTFYLKETAVPTKDPAGNDYSYTLDPTVYEVTISSNGELTMRKKSSSTSTTFDEEVYKVRTSDASVTPAVYQYRVMNTSSAQHKVILRKVSDTYKAFAGARLRIFKVDLTEVTEGQPVYTAAEAAAAGDASLTGKAKGYYESGSAGAYFIGKLPAGKYYLLETKVPEGAKAENLGKVFILNVKADGTIEQKDLGRINNGMIDNTLLTEIVNGNKSLKTFTGTNYLQDFRSWIMNQ